MSYPSDTQCDLLSVFRLYDFAVKHIFSHVAVAFDTFEKQRDRLVDVDIALKDMLNTIGGYGFTLAEAKAEVSEDLCLEQFGFENIGQHGTFRHFGEECKDLEIPLDFDERFAYWHAEGFA